MTNETTREGQAKLWLWFGLTRASFLTIPRVLMHDMPDEWQGKMADLLNEYYEMFPNLPDIGTTVRATRNRKLVPMPEFLINYRYPDYAEIRAMRKKY